jgi:hypothetical protein
MLLASVRSVHKSTLIEHPQRKSPSKSENSLNKLDMLLLLKKMSLKCLGA